MKVTSKASEPALLQKVTVLAKKSKRTVSLLGGTVNLKYCWYTTIRLVLYFLLQTFTWYHIVDANIMLTVSTFDLTWTNHRD